MKEHRKIYWRWLGIFFLGLVIWVLGKGVFSAIISNFIVSTFGVGEYIFVFYSLLSAFFVAFLLYFLYQKVQKEKFKVFGLTKKKLISDWFIGVILAMVLASISLFIIIPYLGPDHETYIAVAKQVNELPLVNIIIAGVVLGGFAEELFFRGHIVASISEIIPDNIFLLILSIIVSATFFGFAHKHQGAFGIVFGGVHSIIYALLYIKRKSLVSPMIAHALYDVLVAIGIKYFITF